MATEPAQKPPRTYQDEFKARIAALEKHAIEAGLNLTEVCRQAGVSRATPDRWRKRTPKTIALVTQMEAIVAAAAAKKTKPQP